VGNYPGLCASTTNKNSFAVEVFTYLQLTAGINRFRVESDDSLGIYSGANLDDTSVPLYQHSGSRGAVTIDFFVMANGLYPFHIIHSQGGGAAAVRIHSVNLSDNHHPPERYGRRPGLLSAGLEVNFLIGRTEHLVCGYRRQRRERAGADRKQCALR